MALIELETVRFGYGLKIVLNGFSLTVERGERVCLCGPSGCGKTSVLKLIEGLAKPQDGRVTVRTDRIRPVFQEDRLLPFLTVQRNTAMFAEAERAAAVLEELGLAPAAELYPDELSGGMARRAALARALAGEGELYIFDEPFNGLDAENVDIAVRTILERTAGGTLLCVLHEREHARRLGCRIVEMG